LVEAFKAQSLLEVTAVGTLRQVTVTTQIGVVDFAADHENGGYQGQQKLPLGFVEMTYCLQQPG